MTTTTPMATDENILRSSAEKCLFIQVEEKYKMLKYY